MLRISSVRCHMSGVTCQVSRVGSQMHFIYGQSVGASQWRVWYQPGLACLVSICQVFEEGIMLGKLDNV